MDPASLAINTARGQAMHDVVRYALWVARVISGDGKRLDTAISFEVMTEVRNVLTERLDVAVEPSAAVRFYQSDKNTAMPQDGGPSVKLANQRILRKG